MLTVRLFEQALRQPAEPAVAREMTVTLGARQRPEPDIKTYVPTGIHLRAAADLCRLRRGHRPLPHMTAGRLIEMAGTGRPIAHLRDHSL